MKSTTKLPASLVRALSRLTYHDLGLMELAALALTKPRTPAVDRQLAGLRKRHPALAVDPIEPEAEKRRARALRRTRVPAAYRQGVQ